MSSKYVGSYKNLKKHVLAAEHHFALLGVNAGSTEEEIGAGRRFLAGEFHPDRNSDPDAAGIMASINAAHATLTDTALRAKYMAGLRTGRTECTGCEGAGYTKKQKGFKKVVKAACALCGGCGLMKKEK